MHGLTQVVIAGLILGLMPIRPAISAETEVRSTDPNAANETAAPVIDAISAEKQTPDRARPTGLESAAAAAPDSNTAGKRPSTGQALDLSGLEQRLHETDAIGVFTKLALKNQIDDLLDAFRIYHRRNSDAALRQLRERYNLLLLKVQSLLQDDAPQLARDVYRSREAIWGLLADPQEFAKLQTKKDI